MRFFVTGDTHGRLDRIYNWVDKMNFNNENINIIIAGDAGICWRKDCVDMDTAIRRQEQYKFHLWFVCGNHENFDILDQIPRDENGIAHLTNNLHYISRGSIITFNHKTILCCGGADSVDKHLRTKHISWWPQEQITEDDINKCLNNNLSHYDYIITHTCPLSVFKKNMSYLCTLDLNQSEIDHTSEERLEKLVENISFNKWFFGHFHVDKQLDDKYTCLYQDFMEI